MASERRHAWKRACKLILVLGLLAYAGGLILQGVGFAVDAPAVTGIIVLIVGVIAAAAYAVYRLGPRHRRAWRRFPQEALEGPVKCPSCGCMVTHAIRRKDENAAAPRLRPARLICPECGNDHW